MRIRIPVGLLNLDVSSLLDEPAYIDEIDSFGMCLSDLIDHALIFCVDAHGRELEALEYHELTDELQYKIRQKIVEEYLIIDRHESNEKKKYKFNVKNIRRIK